MYEILPNLATCSILESNTPEGWVIVDVRDLIDGAGNSVEEVAKKISLVGNLMCAGFKVVVRCNAGMSRSNTIACAVMLWCQIYEFWDDAWKAVQETCPRAMLSQGFYNTVKKALLTL
jgi:protein-tyrosine phosphatase